MTFTLGRGARITGSGWRKVRQKSGEWTCWCPALVNGATVLEARQRPGYLVRCPDCKAERPS